MTNDEIKDLCLSKIHQYRSELSSAFAGTSTHHHVQVEQTRASLKFWERVATALGRDALTPDLLGEIEATMTKRR